MSIIAIDCGASFIKAAKLSNDFVTVEQQILYRTSEIVSVIDQKDNTLPQQLKNTISAVKKSILNLTEEGDAICLGVCNEMHGFVLTNHNLMPYTDYVSWQKDYILEEHNDFETWQQFLQSRITKEDIQKTGMPFKPGLPSGNMAYLLQSNCIAADSREMLFFTLGDFIVSWMSGQVSEIHPTNAAASGLYDLTKKDWNWKLIRDLQLGDIQFPKVYHQSAPLFFQWRGRKIQMYPALGDQQAALLGAGLHNDGQLSVNMGTGAQVSILSNTIEFSDVFQTRPYFENQYLFTVPHIPSGRALNVFFGFVKQIADKYQHKSISDDDIWKWINEEAGKIERGTLEIDLSFFSNAITKRTAGSIQNIGEDQFTIGNLFLSIYQQMGANVFECVHRICKDTRLINEVIFSGGVVRKNKILREYIAKYFGTTMMNVVQNETFLGIAQYMKSHIMK